MKDLISKIGPVAVLAPAVLTANNTSAAIDLQGFNSAAFVVNTGAIAGDGLFSTVIEESDTTAGGDFAAVQAMNLEGALPEAFAANSVYKIGYTGTKRYVRAVTTKASGTSIAASIVMVKGHPDAAPVA